MFVSYKGQEDSLNSHSQEEKIQQARLQAAAFSFICAVCALFAAAAATRIPAFLEAGAYGKMASVALFAGIVLLCIIDNVRIHLALSGIRSAVEQQNGVVEA